MGLPRVSDQGQTDSCHRHALGKSVCALFHHNGFDLKQEAVISDCKQIFRNCRPKNVLSYHEKKMNVAEISHGWSFTVKLHIKKINPVCYLENQASMQYVLGYNHDNGELHCVYIRERVENTFCCINSLGENNNPNPRFKWDNECISIYSVEVTVTAKVVSIYIPNEGNVLSINIGDIITNVKLKADGWWEGELNGEVGIFHKNCVDLVEDVEVAVNAKVLYDWVGDKEGDLTVKKDDMIKVHVYSPEDEWWKGEYNGNYGMFPANHVELVAELQTPDEKEIDGDQITIAIHSDEITSEEIQHASHQDICQEDIFSDKTICDICIKHIQKFAQILDTSDTCNSDWCSFGKAIIEIHGDDIKFQDGEYKELMNEVDDYERYVHGGGDPGKQLLDILSIIKPDLLVYQFSDVAKKLERKDIVNLLQGQQGSGDLCDIRQDCERKLVRMLNKGKDAVNYCGFASNLELGEMQIKELKVEIRRPGYYGPTEAVFNLFKSRFPSLSLHVIYKALESIGRNDLKIYLVDEFATVVSQN